MKGRSMRLPFKRGRLLWLPEDLGEAVTPGNLFFNGWLDARLLDRHGCEVDAFCLGSGVVTDDGVEHLVDDFTSTGAAEIANFNFHDSGTGTTAAAVTDAALEAEAGPTTRATGTQSQPAANQYRSVGTIAYTGTLAITEWGLFSTAARTTDLLWDRRVFSAINVVNGDSIEFTYTLTVSSGG
jgi:hypothetical protein